ncbi:hypothetical protein D1872_324910 [compost metagenome]
MNLVVVTERARTPFISQAIVFINKLVQYHGLLQHNRVTQIIVLGQVIELLSSYINALLQGLLMDQPYTPPSVGLFCVCGPYLSVARIPHP